MKSWVSCGYFLYLNISREKKILQRNNLCNLKHVCVCDCYSSPLNTKQENKCTIGPNVPAHLRIFSSKYMSADLLPITALVSFQEGVWSRHDCMSILPFLEVSENSIQSPSLALILTALLRRKLVWERDPDLRSPSTELSRWFPED